MTAPGAEWLTRSSSFSQFPTEGGHRPPLQRLLGRVREIEQIGRKCAGGIEKTPFSHRPTVNFTELSQLSDPRVANS